MLELSSNLSKAVETKTIRPNIVVNIEGLPLIYARYPTSNNSMSDGIQYNENYILDYFSKDKSVYALLDLKSTTSQIQHQITPDKSGMGSSSSFKIGLIDFNEVVSKMISPFFMIDDILGRKCQCYYTLNDLSYPFDATLFYTGIVEGVEIGSGKIELNLASPDYLKRNIVFPKVSTKITIPLNNVATNFQVEDPRPFPVGGTGSGALTFYLKVDDEIMAYTGHTDVILGNFASVTRGALGTVAASHDSGASVEILYRLQGNMRDLALKLMLSTNVDDEFFGARQCSKINNTGPFPNSIEYIGPSAKKGLGLVSGDFVKVENSASNDGTYTITSITYDETTNKNYIQVSSTLVNEVVNADISFKSKYNTLGDFGLSMTPEQVDVARHEDIFSTDSVGFADFDFYIKEDIKGDEFINKELYFPNGCYQIPRETKTSIGILRPPIGLVNIKRVSKSNIIGGSNIRITRSMSKDFYNAVVYKYDKEVLGDKFLTGRINYSAVSSDRIKTGVKPLVIESTGIKTYTGLEIVIDKRSTRILDRYQYGAETISVKVLFSEFFNTEVGDVVFFDGSDLNLTDTKTGSRNFALRIMEVTNISKNFTTGEINLQLTDTSYSSDGRYGLIAPSSKLAASGNTTSILNLVDSYGTLVNSYSETSKYADLIGEQILVFNSDYTYSQVAKIEAITGSNQIEVSGLSSAPNASDFNIRLANYDETAPYVNAVSKAIYGYANKTSTISTIVDSRNFIVPDGTKFNLGSVVHFHNSDYTLQSEKEFRVVAVSLNQITINKDIDYAWAVGHTVDLIGFKDNGAPYRIS